MTRYRGSESGSTNNNATMKYLPLLHSEKEKYSYYLCGKNNHELTADNFSSMYNVYSYAHISYARLYYHLEL